MRDDRRGPCPRTCTSCDGSLECACTCHFPSAEPPNEPVYPFKRVAEMWHSKALEWSRENARLRAEVAKMTKVVEALRGARQNPLASVMSPTWTAVWDALAELDKKGE